MTTWVIAAWFAVHFKISNLHAQFLRLKTHCGAKKAILAVAASMWLPRCTATQSQTTFAKEM